MRKAAAAKRGAKDTASRARAAARKAKNEETTPDGTGAADNRAAVDIAATAGTKDRHRGERYAQGARNWGAQPGAKILVTTADGQVHEATIITEMRRAVVAELRDDQGTRVMAAYSPNGGAGTWRTDDGSVDAPLAAGPTPAPSVANTRIGRERDRNRLTQADWVQRQQMALGKLAPKDEPLYSDAPFDEPELKDFPLDTATPKTDAENKAEADKDAAIDG